MFIRVLSLVYLFLIRLRFPPGSSVSDVIRKRYGNTVLSKLRKYEKLDLKIGKAKLDISFLEVCIEQDLTPTFVQFRTANRNLRNSESYTSCQRMLLSQERQNKQEKQDKDSQSINQIRNELRETMSSLDYLFISSLFLESNRKALERIQSKQNRKLSKLMEDNPVHDVDDLVFNFSSHTLTDAQKSILSKGLNFALPPKKLRYEDYLLNFELLFKSSKDSESVKNGDIEEFKSNSGLIHILEIL